jgi:hypothetical protein
MISVGIRLLFGDELTSSNLSAEIRHDFAI